MDPSEIGKVQDLKGALMTLMILIDRYDLGDPLDSYNVTPDDQQHWEDALAEARLLLGYDRHD